MRGHAGGFTLVEVLVALFVLAIGILGAAATQGAALRMRHQSALMSRGVQLAATLADAMRANPAAMQARDEANAYLQFRYDVERDGAPSGGPACYGAACSADELPAFELAQLRQALYDHFPGGRALVCRDRQIWDPARRALAWECAGGGGAPVVIKLGWREGEIAANAPSIAIVVGGAP